MNYPVSTSIHFRFDSEYKVPVTHEIERISGCGFRYLDFNFLDWHSDPRSPFLSDGWKEWIADAGECAAKCGARFNQAHAPVQTDLLRHDLQRMREMQLRAIESASMLGIPWMVFHAGPFPNETYIEDNVTYYRTLLDAAHKFDVGIAIENIWPVNQKCPIWKTEKLIELVDELDDPFVGICWDTGHCNMTANSSNYRERCLPELKKYSDQYAEITKLGKRLKALHIDDNNGMDDDHIAPYDGTIDWASVMRALKDIGYEHSFTFECHNAVRRLPEEMANDKIAYLHKLGVSLVNMY